MGSVWEYEAWGCIRGGASPNFIYVVSGNSSMQWRLVTVPTGGTQYKVRKSVAVTGRGGP
jgi:hypothetical protein